MEDNTAKNLEVNNEIPEASDDRKEKNNAPDYMSESIDYLESQLHKYRAKQSHNAASPELRAALGLSSMWSWNSGWKENITHLRELTAMAFVKSMRATKDSKAFAEYQNMAAALAQVVIAAEDNYDAENMKNEEEFRNFLKLHGADIPEASQNWRNMYEEWITSLGPRSSSYNKAKKA
jgi:hypothetical protein